VPDDIFTLRLDHSFADVLRLWKTAGFCEYFVNQMNQVAENRSFRGYFWRHPEITAETLGRPYESKLVRCDALADPAANSSRFRKKFRNAEDDVVVFDSLGGDARLVVPTLVGPRNAYGHIAPFLKGPPEMRFQIHAIFRRVSLEVEEVMQRNRQPVFLNTHGSVPWVHLRLDSWPKYYEK
jgi:hypothetical protein